MTSKLAKIIILLDRFASQLIIIFFTFVLLISLYAIYDAVCVHNETRVISDASKLVDAVPDNERIAELKKTNDEIVAWVQIDGTAIDYPVTQAKNNQFYLTHDYKKDYSIAGSIFADFRSNLLEDDYAIIYGHNMNGNSMFGELNKFDDSKFFESHQKSTVYLENGRYEAEVLAYTIISSDSETIYDLDDVKKDSNDKILAEFQNRATNKRSLDKPYTNLLLLSTCHLHSGERAVVLMGFNR